MGAGLGGWTGVPPLPALPDAAAIAAFKTTVKGGLIPQARQGGSGVAALAVVGSKLDGIGLEKVQIGQIQVAFWDLEGVETGVCRRGESLRGVGAAILGDCRPERVPTAEGRDWFTLGVLGKRVILADDLRKPACQLSATDMRPRQGKEQT